MRSIHCSFLLSLLFAVPAPGADIPFINLADDTARQVVVDREKGQLEITAFPSIWAMSGVIGFSSLPAPINLISWRPAAFGPP